MCYGVQVWIESRGQYSKGLVVNDVVSLADPHDNVNRTLDRVTTLAYAVQVALRTTSTDSNYGTTHCDVYHIVRPVS